MDSDFASTEKTWHCVHRRTEQMDIYVGNLAYSTTDEALKSAFAVYGEVSAARVVMDRMSGRSKGFGFVEMPDNAQAPADIIFSVGV